MRTALPWRMAVFDDGGELAVLLVLEADIAGVDPVFVEGFGAGRVLGEELVADIVEVADERRGDAEPGEPVADMRDRGGGLVAIDRDAHDFRAGAGERRDLRDRRIDIRRVRIGHRLDDDRSAAADRHGADPDGDGRVARRGRGRPFERALGRKINDCHATTHATARGGRRLAEAGKPIRQARLSVSRGSARTVP